MPGESSSSMTGAWSPIRCALWDLSGRAGVGAPARRVCAAGGPSESTGPAHPPAVGTSETFPDVRNWPLQSGVFFTSADVTGYRLVAALGLSVAQELFPDDESPLGKYVMIGTAPFQIVGVLTSKGVSSRGYDLDYQVWIPYTTASSLLFGRRYFEHVNVKVTNASLMKPVDQSIHAVLIRSHAEEDFNIRNMADLL